MSEELNPEEERALRARLAGAVPEHRAIPERAARAIRGGRRRRSVAVAATTAACLAVVGAVALPVLRGDDRTRVDSPSSAGPATSRDATTTAPSPGQVPTSCVPDGALTSDVGRGETAVWIRFCGPDPATHPTPVSPDFTLTDGVAELVEGWQSIITNCALPGPDSLSNRYQLQIGYANGDVRALEGLDASCKPVTLGGQELGVAGRLVFDQTLTAMGQQLAASAEPGAAGEPLRCPRNPRRPAESDVTTDGFEEVARFPIPLPSQRGLLCRYELAADRQTVRLVGSRELGASQAEGIRIAYHTRSLAMVDCEPTYDDPLYAVVLEDITGSRRTFGVDLTECGTMYPAFGDSPWGLASPVLTQLLSRGWDTTRGAG